MEIKKIRDGSKLTVEIVGRLDAVSAMDLDKNLSKNELSEVTELTIDMTKLDYIASAGLRILLKLHKFMSSKGKMIIKNPQKEVSDVIEMSGFSRILTVEGERKQSFEFSIAGDNNDSQIFKL